MSFGTQNVEKLIEIRWGWYSGPFGVKEVFGEKVEKLAGSPPQPTIFT
jgi:hypothetical protein